jgi:RNA polymerase sigma-70 factor (ECF subfamily)
MAGVVERVYEQLLVLRCQTGDGDAFTELIGLYGPQMRRYLGHWLLDKHAVEDLLQEIWFDVHRGLGRLKDIGAFRVWLYRIARNRAVRELRKRRPAPQALAETDVAHPAASDEALDPDGIARVQTVLSQLAPEQREALMLRFVEGLTYEEIAGIVNCPIGTVRSRLHHAKRGLRRILERSEAHD